MKKIFTTAVILVILAIAGSLFAGCEKYNKKGSVSSTSGLATLACEESFKNILDQEIGVFEFIYPDATILPYYISGEAAIDSLMALVVPTAVTSRELTSDELSYLKEKKRTPHTSRIAVDAVAVIVNPQNPMEELSLNEIRKILTGEFTDWNQLEPNKSGEIVAMFDSKNGSGIATYMKDSLINGADFGPNVYAEDNTPAVIKRVREVKGAIGFISVSWLSTDLAQMESGTFEQAANYVAADDAIAIRDDEASLDSSVKVMRVRRDHSIRSFKPYQYEIYTGDYPLYRSIYMITTSFSGTPDHGFYAFVTSVRGQKIILKTGICPAILRTSTMMSLE